MSAFSVILLAALFCMIQMACLKKVSKKWLKYLPTAIGGVGVVIGLAIYCLSKEIVWIALFLASGFLLSQEKIWGSIFGMIPGIVFVWMSTNYTGQVINIELPLGMLIIGFYAGCGMGIYRKRQLKK